jgi:adenylate cyclase
MNERLKKILSITPLKLTILIIFIILILFFMDLRFVKFMELKALDLRIVSRGVVQPGGEVVIATIDEKSLSELGRWPWPRMNIAKLIDTLKQNGVKAVGFDIDFAESDQNASIKALGELSAELKKSGVDDARVQDLLNRKKMAADTDAVLARSIAQAKNVTLGYLFHLSAKDVAHLTKEEIDKAAENITASRYQMIREKAKPDEAAFIHAYAAATNITSLSEAAENSGYFNAFPDTDGTFRWMPLIIKFQDNYYMPLSLSVITQYLDSPMTILNLNDFGVEGITIGDMDIPTDEDGRILINYLGPAKTFPHYGISDILKGRIAPEKLKGKIVLVGATAVGIGDLRVTPFNAAYPGIELHATIIDNILHQRFLQRSGWSSLIDVCALIFFGLLAGLVIPRVKAVLGIFLTLLMVVFFVVGNILIFSHFNMWLNLIYPVLTMIAVYLGISIYRYITEEREKKKIKGAFQYYLTASVINEMLKDPTKLKLGGDKKDLSVLFSDIRGFTSISEKLTPEALVQLLNEYLTAMTNVVFHYDGLLDKYMGDAIMAVFGAPLDQPDHPVRACRTALGMMAELKKLQAKWSDEGRPVMNIGVGVNTGDMVVGNMGSEMRFDYTVMGDAVNLGSRLEGINKEYGTNIVISEYTHEKVKDIFLFRELDSVRVKGKNQPVRIYELIGYKDDKDYPEKWGNAVGLFEEGLAKYKQGLWDEAIECFGKVMEIRPSDPPSLLYIERCRTLKETPPAEPWDGVYTMTKK